MNGSQGWGRGGGRPEVLVKRQWSMVVVDESGGAKLQLVRTARSCSWGF